MGPVGTRAAPLVPTGPIGGSQLVLKGGASVGVVSGHGAALAAAPYLNNKLNNKLSQKLNNKPNNKTAEPDP